MSGAEIARRRRRPKVSITLADVLAMVVPGRVVRPELLPEQQRALHCDNNALALEILQHLLGAREAAGVGADEQFPMTATAMQAVALRLGRKAGIKRLYKARSSLERAGVIAIDGSYRREGLPRQTKVTLWRLTSKVAVRPVPGTFQASNGRRRCVNRATTTPWWLQPLFGMVDGRPPPASSRRQARRLAIWQERKDPRTATA